MRSYFRYLPISRSSGSMFARTLPCEMTTPRGSAVVPEVKTICTMSSRVRGGGVTGCVGVSRESFAQLFQIQGWNARDFVVRAAHAQFRVDLFGDAAREVRCGDFVDGNDNRTAQQASEEGGDPLGAVLAPDEYLVALADAARVEFTREAIGACRGRRRSSSAGCGIRGDGRKRSRERGGESCPGNQEWWCEPSMNSVKQWPVAGGQWSVVR